MRLSYFIMIGGQEHCLEILVAECSSEILFVDGMSGGGLSGGSRMALVAIGKLSNAAWPRNLLPPDGVIERQVLSWSLEFSGLAGYEEGVIIESYIDSLWRLT